MASGANQSLHRPNQSLPLPQAPPPRWATTAITGASAQAARAPAWAVVSSEHVDHIVALKEAYDSGAAAWSSTRKAEFANDPANLWCLAASVNLSKSDGDLAEWAGGSCAQRKRIATVTQQVKRAYGLSTDGAEQRAITVALAAQCTPLTDSQSGTTESSASGTQSDAGSGVAGGASETPAPADGANSQAEPNQPDWCFSPPPLRVIALAPHLMDYCHDDSWRQLVPNN